MSKRKKNVTVLSVLYRTRYVLIRVLFCWTSGNLIDLIHLLREVAQAAEAALRAQAQDLQAAGHLADSICHSPTPSENGWNCLDSIRLKMKMIGVPWMSSVSSYSSCLKGCMFFGNVFPFRCKRAFSSDWRSMTYFSEVTLTLVLTVLQSSTISEMLRAPPPFLSSLLGCGHHPELIAGVLGYLLPSRHESKFRNLLGCTNQ